MNMELPKWVKPALSALTVATALQVGIARSDSTPRGPEPIAGSATIELAPKTVFSIKAVDLTVGSHDEIDGFRTSLNEKLKKGPFQVAVGLKLDNEKLQDQQAQMEDVVKNTEDEIGLKPSYVAKHIPAALYTINDPAEIDVLLDQDVFYIEYLGDKVVIQGQNPEIEELIGTNKADSLLATGYGWQIASPDTGVKDTHPIFENGQRIITSVCVLEGDRCPNGTSFDDTTPNAASTCEESRDDCIHGTATASEIVEFSDASLIIGLVETVGDILRFIDFVIGQPQPVAGISISFSWGDGTIGSCADDHPAFANMFEQVVNFGIPIIVASGNDGFGNGTRAPACIILRRSPSNDGVIPVGSSGMKQNPNMTFNEWISGFSNRDPENEILLAPGEDVNVANASTGTYVRMSGTSMSAPITAAAVARIRSKYPYLTPGQIEELLKLGGVELVERYWLEPSGDEVDNSQFRINVDESVRIQALRQNPVATLRFPAVLR